MLHKSITCSPAGWKDSVKVCTSLDTKVHMDAEFVFIHNVDSFCLTGEPVPCKGPVTVYFSRQLTSSKLRLQQVCLVIKKVKVRVHLQQLGQKQTVSSPRFVSTSELSEYKKSGFDFICEKYTFHYLQSFFNAFPQIPPLNQTANFAFRLAQRDAESAARWVTSQSSWGEGCASVWA